MYQPDALFDRVFADIKSDPDAVRRIRAQNKSVLDAAMGQTAPINAKLSSGDKYRVDNYLTSLRALEASLTKEASAGCQPPEVPSGLPEITHHKNHDKIPEYTRMHLEILAMAMACDLTRVGTFQLSEEANNFTFPWLDVTTRWHDQSHYKADAESWKTSEKKQGAADYLRICRWSMESLAYLVERLDALGVLDNTLILYLSHMHHGGQHTGNNIPVMTIGNIDNKWRAGRHVSFFPKEKKSDLRQTNDFFVTLANLYGIEISDFGERDKNKGTLPNLLA
jgi:hypothetical protein